jgi:hypothetical protein
VVTLSASGVVLLGLIGWALVGMIAPERCSTGEIDGVQSFALLSASLLGFVGGHVLGRWMEASSSARPWPAAAAVGAQLQKSQRRRRRLTGALLVQGGLVLFLLLSTALLAYETLALVDIDRNWPITFFVRCFTHTNLAAAAIGSLAFCFMLGHWVWYPSRDDRD